MCLTLHSLLSISTPLYKTSAYEGSWRGLHGVGNMSYAVGGFVQDVFWEMWFIDVLVTAETYIPQIRLGVAWENNACVCVCV